MSVLNVGIDLGVTSKHEAQIRDEEGKEVHSSFSFSGSIEGFDTLCAHALKDAPEGTKLRFICEPTSMSWFPLAVYALSHGHEMVRVKSQRAHDLREYYSKHRKRDRIDARVLSLMPVVDRDSLEEVYLPDKLIQALDRRCRQREKIAKAIASAKARLKSLYHWVMPGLTSCFEDPFGSRARAFYAKYTNPFKVKQLGFSKLTLFLNKAGRQEMNPELPEKVYQVAMEASNLYESASEQIDFDEIQEEVECELQLLESYKKVQAKVDAAIRCLYDQAHPTKNIETISGISDTLGPVFVGIVGNPGRFPSQSKMRDYSGIIPKQDDSGERSKKGLDITKDGPPRYRRGLYLAADVGRQWDPQLAKIYYDQMVHKGNCHTQAVCAVATHLPARIHLILKEDRPYELRDLEGNPISKRDAKRLIQRELTVPEEVRQRTRSRKRRRRRREGYTQSRVRGLAELLQASRFA
ncbi:transposase [candidate division NPL-UPA2 bacterium]|nr:transposase [candidate division NPL-UPA2 bacterium]